MPPEATTGRQMTYGEKAVGLTFNPSGDAKVQEVKELYAKAIDILASLPVSSAINDERLAMLAHAIREAQTAQMWAVKVITFR